MTAPPADLTREKFHVASECVASYVLALSYLRAAFDSGDIRDLARSSVDADHAANRLIDAWFDLDQDLVDVQAAGVEA